MTNPSARYRLGRVRADVWRRPAPPKGLMDFARTLRFGEGKRVGKLFVPESHPAQHYLLTAITEYREVKLLKPVQDGGTWASQIVPALWLLLELDQGVVYGAPDMGLCSKFWTQKLRPTLDKSGLLHRIPESGKGSRGGSPDEVHFVDGGVLTFMGAGAGNEGAQAMVTARAAFTDEYDSIEAYRRRLIKARTKHYGAQAIGSDCSTLKEALGDSLLWQEYQTISTGTRLAFCCPHTGYYRLIEKEDLEFDNTDPLAAHDSARLVFTNPDGTTTTWTESDRQQALKRYLPVHRGQAIVHSVDESGQVIDARVIGRHPRTDVLGLRYTCFHSPNRDIRDIAKRWCSAQQLAAGGDESELASLTRDEFVEPFVSQVTHEDGLAPAAIAARVTNHARRDIPADTTHITVGTDPGGARTGIHWVALAWRPNCRAHVFDYGRFAPIATDGDAVLAALQAWWQDVLIPGWGQGRLPDLTYLDSNWETEWVDRFCRQAGFDRFKPIQGFSETQHGAGRKRYIPKHAGKAKDVLRHDRMRENSTWHESRLQHRGRLVRLDADHWKRTAHTMLRVPMTQPNSISLFDAKPELHLHAIDIPHARKVPGFATQVCAERQAYSEKEGRYVFQPCPEITKENHWLDALAYALAAGDYLGLFRSVAAPDRPRVKQATRHDTGMTTPDGRPFLLTQR